MIDTNRQIIKTFEFVVELLEKISAKRENRLFISRCKLLKSHLDSLNNQKDLPEIRIDLYQMIDELKFIIQAEIRFFLFPLPDIKQETYELGKRYMSNFLEWFKPEENIPVEEILKLLDDEIYLLAEAKHIMEKLELKVAW